MRRLTKIPDIKQDKFIAIPMGRMVLLLFLCFVLLLFTNMTSQYKTLIHGEKTQPTSQEQVLGTSDINYKRQAADMLQNVQGHFTNVIQEKIASIEATTNNLASTSAQRVTDIIYSHTIERVILELIHSLPAERQKKYAQ